MCISLSIPPSSPFLSHLRGGVEGELNGSLGGFQVREGAGLTEEVLTGSLAVTGAAHVAGSEILHAPSHSSH